MWLSGRGWCWGAENFDVEAGYGVWVTGFSSDHQPSAVLRQALYGAVVCDLKCELMS